MKLLLTLAFATFASLVPCACGTPATDSKTNWLVSCSIDDDCDDGTLQCLCGICTSTCDSDDDCQQGNAICVDATEASFQVQCGGTGQSFCARECDDDADCGDTQECVLGACAEVETPTAPGCAATDIDEASTAFEFELFEVVNRARGGTELSCASSPMAPLLFDARLRCAARLHAQDMVEDGYLDVTAPTGETAMDWMAVAGFAPSVWGSSVAQSPGQTPEEFLDFISDQYTNSTGDERLNCLNVVDTEYSRLGVGYRDGVFSLMYATE